MKIAKILFGCFLLHIILLFGCATIDQRANLVPFSKQLISKYNLSEDDLKKIQYYVSGPIILERRITTADQGNILKDKLVARKGSMYEIITVAKGTPGIAIRSYKNKDIALLGGKVLDTENYFINISFEEGSYIEFCYSDAYQCDFSLRIYNKNKTYFGCGGSSGYIVFDGNDYLLKSDYRVKLMVDEDSLSKIGKTRRALPGRRLDNQE